MEIHSKDQIISDFSLSLFNSIDIEQQFEALLPVSSPEIVCVSNGVFPSFEPSPTGGLSSLAGISSLSGIGSVLPAASLTGGAVNSEEESPPHAATVKSRSTNDSEFSNLTALDLILEFRCDD